MTHMNALSNQLDSASIDRVQAVIDTIRANVAILSSDGTLLSVNKAWRAGHHANSLIVPPEFVGANYFRACESVAGEFSEDPADLIQAMREVGQGQRNAFAQDYAWHDDDAERWYRLRCVRLESCAPAIEYLNGDVSKSRFAELAALAPRMIVFDHHAEQPMFARITAQSPRVLVIHRDITAKKRSMLSAQRRFNTLTQREREIVDLLARGLSSKEIASSNGVSVRTIENHRYRILAKTHARNVAELIRLALLAKVVQS